MTLTCALFYSAEEGGKELEKERERITPFITFQQVTTTATATASSSKALECEASDTASSSVAPQKSVEMTPSGVTKVGNTLISTSSNITLIPMDSVGSKECLLQMGFTPSVRAARNSEPTTTGNNSMQPALLVPKSISPAEIRSCPTDDHGSTNCSAKRRKTDSSCLSTLPHSPTPTLISSPTSNSSVDLNLADLLGNHTNSRDLLKKVSDALTSVTEASQIVTSPSSRPTPPRLKRSLSDVNELIVTSSAKRSMVPTAFIVPYSHHSPNLSSKWVSDAKTTATSTTTTTVLFDQHNNNG